MSATKIFNTTCPYTKENFMDYSARVGMSGASIQKGIDFVERKKAQGHSFIPHGNKNKKSPICKPD